MSAFLTLDGVSKVFRPNLTLGEKIAAKLGSNVEQRPLHAVDNVSLTVAEGETFGLVGESGCGKSTLGVSLPASFRQTPAPCDLAESQSWTEKRR